MPEGHVSHRNAIRLGSAVAGQTIVRVEESPRVAAQRLAERMTGRVITRVEAVGKHHLIHLDDGHVLHSHLGLVGRWRVQRADTPLATGGLWLALFTGVMVAAQYRGPSLRLHPPGAVIPQVRCVGPDLLAADGNPDPSTRIDVARVPASRLIGDVLLDQRIVSGIGNIYRSEALWDVHVNPWTPIGEITQGTADAIIASAARLLSDAVGLDRGRAVRRHAVHRRTGRPCPRCGTPVRAMRHGDDNRAVYWCPACQPGG